MKKDITCMIHMSEPGDYGAGVETIEIKETVDVTNLFDVSREVERIVEEAVSKATGRLRAKAQQEEREELERLREEEQAELERRRDEDRRRQL